MPRTIARAHQNVLYSFHCRRKTFRGHCSGCTTKCNLLLEKQNLHIFHKLETQEGFKVPENSLNESAELRSRLSKPDACEEGKVVWCLRSLCSSSLQKLNKFFKIAHFLTKTCFLQAFM
jgi:hypothetical protein